MVTKIIPELHQSPVQSPGAKSGSLKPGQALSWQPREAGVLALTQGRAWLTFDGPHAGHGNESGDCFLQAGQALEVDASQRLVIETWGPVPVFFEWTATRQARAWWAVFPSLMGLGWADWGRGAASSWRVARSRLARV